MESKAKMLVFCENIKYIRKIHKLSKKEMSKKLGIGVATLSLIESGILPPRLNCDVLYEIYHHFGITPNNMLEYLLCDKNARG